MAKRIEKRALSVCEALRRLKPLAVDQEAIDALVGGASVKTIADVAEQFGMQTSTVKTSWRANGMPGTSGAYNLAEIAAWRIEKDGRGFTLGEEDAATDDAVETLGADEFNERIEALEVMLNERLLTLERSIKRVVENALADKK